jgi:transaldolase
VNVTLILSLERHREVSNAYLSGLEKAKAAGIDLSTIESVASFFVSRVDTEVNKRLDAIGTEEATALKSKAGIANARLAYQVYEQAFSSERAKLLLEAGANKQRPLWASTGVKDASLPDTLYVTELAVADVVNTMPEKTLEATFDHGVIQGDRVTGFYDDANAVLDQLAAQGISYDEVTQLLEKEGVDKFIVSWNELLDTVTAALEAAGAQK